MISFFLDTTLLPISQSISGRSFKGHHLSALKDSRSFQVDTYLSLKFCFHVLNWVVDYSLNSPWVYVVSNYSTHEKEYNTKECISESSWHCSLYQWQWHLKASCTVIPKCSSLQKETGQYAMNTSCPIGYITFRNFNMGNFLWAFFSSY